MTQRLLKALAITFAVAILAPSVVRGDGDPASDVLLVRSIFFTYDPPVSPGLQKTLSAEVAAANRANFPVKVALIRSRRDLGLIPELFGKPQQYADFLGRRSRSNTRGRCSW
jgi:hypothetical protein